MALVKDYSSDEDEAVASGDVFGLGSLHAPKKPRVEETAKAALQFSAAPDVLSEVSCLYASVILEYLIFSTRILSTKHH